MITRLNHSDQAVANQIHSVFQHAYKVEADLIGVVDFPPLARTAENIKNAHTEFYGFTEETCLAAVIEIKNDGKCLDIHSLVVAPEFFRKGIADKLIGYVLQSSHYLEAIVETAVLNKPAINLYQKHGFVEFKRFTPSHGIEKLALSTGRGY